MIPATLCVPPCVAMSPQAWEMSRRAPGRLYRSPTSPGRALAPGWSHSSAGKRTKHPVSKTLGTATIPFQRSLPASARFADEHPIQSGAPGAPLSLTPRGLKAFLRSHPCRGRGGNGPKRPASRIRHPTYSVPGVMTWPGADVVRPAGRIGRALPRHQPGEGSGRRTRAPCRSTSSELMCHAIPVSLTIEPRLSR